MKKLIKVRHLKQYVNTTGGQRDTTQEAVVQTPASLAALEAVINYKHVGLVNERHNSKRQRRMLLYAGFEKERVNSIQRNFSEGSVHPIDGIVIFPPIDAK